MIANNFRRDKIQALNDEMQELENCYKKKLKKYNALLTVLRVCVSTSGVTTIICSTVSAALLGTGIGAISAIPISIISRIAGVITTGITSQDAKIIKKMQLYLDTHAFIKKSKLEINAMLSKFLNDDYIDDEEYNSIIEKYKDINAVIANKKSEIINAQC